MKKEVIPWVLVALMFLSALVLLPYMPDEMPTHWNAQGEVDDYSSKYVALFLLPGLALFIFLLFHYLPKISVYQKNISEFKHLEGLKLAIVLFFAVIYFVTLLPVLKPFGMINFNDLVVKVVVIGVSILLYYLGHIIKDIKRNYFIGFRTPWTLANPHVWKKTHRWGSKWFKVCAVLVFFSIFFKSNWVWAFFTPLIVFVFAIFIYSYLEFRRLKK